MSKLFYDNLIVLEEIEFILKKYEFSPDNHAKIGQMIEETVHFRIMNRILTHLPKEHQKEFLERFHKAPYDERLMVFLEEKVEKISGFIRDEMEILKRELLEDLKA